LAVLRHEMDERMVHSQYHHFQSRGEEGAEAVVLPAADDDRMGCLTDVVKVTHALVQDLDEAIKEVKLLGEHEEESSQKITELEEEKATLEGMVESRDELLMVITRETRLDHMGEDDEDEEEDEDADDGEDAAASPATAPPTSAPPQPHQRRSMIKAMWRWSLSRKPQSHRMGRVRVDKKIFGAQRW
jgi:hypothetical protein